MEEFIAALMTAFLGTFTIVLFHMYYDCDKYVYRISKVSRSLALFALEKAIKEKQKTSFITYGNDFIDMEIEDIKNLIKRIDKRHNIK